MNELFLYTLIFWVRMTANLIYVRKAHHELSEAYIDCDGCLISRYTFYQVL